MRGAVDHVGAPLVVPEPLRAQTIEDGAEQRGAIEHRRVHHLTLTRRSCLEHPGEHAEREQHGAAGKVAEQAQRGRRRSIGGAHGLERAGQRDVVDVVSRGHGQGAVTAPPGHPGVDQGRIHHVAVGRSYPETLHDARSKALDEHVGVRSQRQEHRHTLGVLEVDPHGAPPAVQGLRGTGAVGRLIAHPGHHISEPGGRIVPRRRACPFDPDHVRTEVGEHHRRKRRRSHTGDLEHSEPHQGAASLAHQLRSASSIVAICRETT